MSTVRQSDYYQLLGVARNAGPAKIKAAFKKRASAFHPDHNPNLSRAAERFGELSEAYRVLSDPELKAGYDKRLATGRETYHAPASTSTSFFERLLERTQGSDLRFTLELDLADVVRGGVFRLDLPRKRICPDCGGMMSTGCLTCHGGGIVIRIDGRFYIGPRTGVISATAHRRGREEHQGRQFDETDLHHLFSKAVETRPTLG